MRMIPILDSQSSSEVCHVVCGSNAVKRPFLLDEIHPLGKLIKADHSYRWENFKYMVHHTGRWLILADGGEFMKFARCGQEYGDER